MQRPTPRHSPRTAARYRLAWLLTQEDFDTAMAEAVTAHRNGDIEDSDLHFVMEIVRAARRTPSSNFTSPGQGAAPP